MVWLVLGTYATIQLVQATIPLWFGQSYIYYQGICSWGFNAILDLAVENGWIRGGTKNNWNVAVNFLTFIVQYTIPTTVVLVSGLVTCTAVWLKSVGIGKKDPKKDVTITVILLTGACVLANGPLSTIACIFIHNLTTGSSHGYSVWLADFAARHAATINSTLNATIYITRIRRLRLFILSRSERPRASLARRFTFTSFKFTNLTFTNRQASQLCSKADTQRQASLCSKAETPI
eukprot:sb/3469332/